MGRGTNGTRDDKMTRRHGDIGTGGDKKLTRRQGDGETRRNGKRKASYFLLPTSVFQLPATSPFPEKH